MDVYLGKYEALCHLSLFSLRSLFAHEHVTKWQIVLLPMVRVC